MKKIIALLLALGMIFCLAACTSRGDKPGNTPSGKQPNNGNQTQELQGFFCPEDFIKEFGKSGASITSDGVKVENDSNGAGGFTVGWDKEFDFNDFSMSFTPYAEKVENDRKWMGFAFTSQSDSWYDSAYSILVLFRFNFKDGVYDGSANFNIVATLAGFQKIEAPATEVVNVPLYMDQPNTFEMKYIESPVNDWTLSINGTSIVVKPQGDSTANSTADFSKVSAQLTNGKCYLQFACNRLEEEGKSSFTVHTVNGTNVTALLNASAQA